MRTGLGFPACLTAVLLSALLPGCGPLEAPALLERPGGTMGDRRSASDELARILGGTIGAAAVVEGTRLLRVQGYGLVIGLLDQGSPRCRDALREVISTEIRRAREAGQLKAYTHLAGASTEEIIRSLDTAVVVVEGEIPAGAPKGRSFDVVVRAVDDETRSIAGGLLLPCDLRIYQAGAGGQVLEGKIRGSAAGTVFVNPFTAEGTEATTINLREGRIIGGGTCSEDRELRLVTVMESYATVRQMREIINRRFGGTEPVADATSPSNINLRVPPRYAGREGQFLELVRYLPMTASPVELEARARTLVGEMARLDAPMNEIALCLEGIGASVLPMIQPLYASPRREVNYHAARTGMRLGDTLAMQVIVQHAEDPRSRFRLPAIRELAGAPDARRAGAALRGLLDDPDTKVRVLAFESLFEVDRPSVARFRVGRNPDNFFLDIVPCESRPLIYVTRTRVPRIVLIGGDRMVCTPPLLYVGGDRGVTLSANAGDRMIRVLRKDPAGTLGPYAVAPEVPVLVKFLGANLRVDDRGQLMGLGLSYGAVIEVLYRLCRRESINADFTWEEPGVEDLLGPLKPTGRPETEL